MVQPSPNWREFSLRNISCYTIKEKPVVLKNAPVSAFSRFKEKVQEKIEVLNNGGVGDASGYEETLNGNLEVTRLEVSQL